MMICGITLMVAGASGYVVKRERRPVRAAFATGAIDQRALDEPTAGPAPIRPADRPTDRIDKRRPEEPINAIKQPELILDPIRPSLPTPLPSSLPPPPVPSPVTPVYNKKAEPSTKPAESTAKEPPRPVLPATPTPRPSPRPPRRPQAGSPAVSPGGKDTYYNIAEPTPTPKLFHQEVVEGDYPAQLENGVSERVRIRLTRKLVENLTRVNQTTEADERRQTRESIEPIPGRPLDVALEESAGEGYDAWIRCRLSSSSIAVTTVESNGDDWRPLGRQLRLEWEWSISSSAPAARQELDAVMEIEWRPRVAGVKTVSRRLWTQQMSVKVDNPLLKSSVIELASPLLSSSGALLTLFAALPFSRRRKVGVLPAESEYVAARTAPQSERPAPQATVPAANLDSKADQSQDVVECSVFGPPTTPQGESIMIQVFAHYEGGDEEAARLAVGFDPTAIPRGVKTLSSRVARGSELMFHLTLSNLNIAEPIQRMVWMGDTESVQYIVEIPGDCRLGNLAGRVTISQNTVPIGQIAFLLRVVPSGASVPEAVEIESEARAYRYTFISYASEDRDKVLARVQMLDQMGIKYFQDLLSLSPGQRWEQELYRNIDQCDLFLLFWSHAAKSSEWVMKEVDYAIARKRGNDEAPPEIKPVIIEGPPLVPPPERLKHLHFNDRLIYLMSRNEEK